MDPRPPGVTTPSDISPVEMLLGGPVLRWVMVLGAVITSVTMVVLLPKLLARPSPLNFVLASLHLAYVVVCMACLYGLHRRQSARQMAGVFFACTIAFLGVEALLQSSQMSAESRLLMSAIGFGIALLGWRRLTIGAAVACALIFLAPLLMNSSAQAGADRLAPWANMLLDLGLMVGAVLLGDHLAQLMAHQLQRQQSIAQQHRLLFERLPVGAIIHSSQEIIDCNEAATHLLQGSGGQPLIGRDVMDLVPADEQAAIRLRLSQLMSLQPGEQLPLRDLDMQDLQGRRVPVSATAVAMDPARGIILVLIIDRTAQDHAQRQLQNSQLLIQALFRVSAHSMAVSDRRTGEFLLVNPAYARTVGREVDDFIGRSVVDMGLASAEQRASLVAAVPHGGSADAVELSLNHRNGEARLLRQSIVSTEFDGREVLVAVGRDVTEDARLERELRVILESVPVAIIVARHGVVTAVSAHYERLLGLPPGTGVGRAYELDIGGPQNLEVIERQWRPIIVAGGIVQFEHEVFRADGTRFPGLFTGRLIRPGARDGFGMVWVIEDLTERQMRESQLARAKADAEAASRAKTGFLATMSHEIRTPLNGILGLIELVRTPQLDESVRRHYLELMTESAHSLQEIVSDVLDVSRIEAGLMPLESKPFELGSWLASIRAAYSALVEAKNLTLNVQVDPSHLGWVDGDAVRLRQILTNYLSNALKFTLSGSITIGVKRLSPTRVRLEVTDTGLGIPADALPRLFIPFSQAGLASSRVQGSGLGLSICRQLAERMGGTAGATSVHGQGSCFWAEVELPEVEPPVAGDESLSVEPSLQGLRLLVVDDNRINLVVARRLLERAGAEVDVADGGQAALDAVDAAQKAGAPYDLVVMDVQMPEMNGMQALAALRERPHGMTLPVLAASAAVTTDEVDLTRAAGFDGFISKPLELSALLRSVLDAVRRGADLRF